MPEDAGVDPRAFHAMMPDSLPDSVIHPIHGRFILDRTRLLPGFRPALKSDDVGLALERARQAGMTRPRSEVLRETVAAAQEAGRDGADRDPLFPEVRR